MLSELKIVADIFDDELERLSEDNVEEGPGFGCTSLEQSRIMISQKANSVTRKQVMITDTNLALAVVDFPSKIFLRQ